MNNATQAAAYTWGCGVLEKGVNHHIRDLAAIQCVWICLAELVQVKAGFLGHIKDDCAGAHFLVGVQHSTG